MPDPTRGRSEPTPLAPRPVTPVGLLAATLGRVGRGVESIPGLDPALMADVRFAQSLAAGLDPYLDRCTTPESGALRRLAEQTCRANWAGSAVEQEMLSGHVEGQVLKMLVHLLRARRVLDVGMFTGYSALAMAEALPQDGRVVACEIDPSVANFAQNCFNEAAHGHKIDVRVGPALATIATLAADGEPFDLVFLDADKSGYLAYLSAVLLGDLLAPHGVIAADNTLMQGQPYGAGESTANGAAIVAFNDAVAADARVEQVLLPLRDGLTLIRRVDSASQRHPAGVR